MIEQEAQEEACVKSQKKYIKLKCINCSLQISKTILEENVISEVSLNGLHSINPIYLRCYILTNKTKLYNKSYIYLYEVIKCISCEEDIGKLVKSTDTKTQHLTDKIIFKSGKELIIEPAEISQSELNEDFNKEKLMLTHDEKLFELKDKNKMFEIVSRNLNDINERLLDYEKYYDKICEDYEGIVKETEDMKKIIYESFEKYKDRNKQEGQENVFKQEQDKFLQINQQSNSVVTKAPENNLGEENENEILKRKNTNTIISSTTKKSIKKFKIKK